MAKTHFRLQRKITLKFPWRTQSQAARSIVSLAEQMKDSLLYAKLPPPLKRSIKLNFLQNGIYDQLIASLEQEPELSGLEREQKDTYFHDGNHNNDNKQTNSIIKRRKTTNNLTILQKTKPCPQRTSQTQSQRAGTARWKTNYWKLNVKTYPPCPHCQRTNHTAGMCWSGSNAAERHKRYKTETPIDSAYKCHKPGPSTQNAPTFILKKSLNWKSHDSTGHLQY